MAKYFFLSISILLNSPILGQLGEPLIGEEYNTARKENFTGFLGENSIGLFTADYVYYSRKKQELIIRQFHKGDLQLVDSKNIYSIIEDGYTNDPKEIFYQDGKFFLFSTLRSERDNTQLLGLEVFNELLERKHYTILDTLESDEMHYIEESMDHRGFMLAKHQKYSQMVEQEISLLAINDTGNIAWTKNIKSPMALNSLRVEQIRYISDGPIYLLCNYAFNMAGGEGNNGQLVDNKYALWAYDHNSRFLKELEVRLKDKYVNGVSMKVNKENKLMLSGYVNETKNPAINGVFSLILGKDFEIEATSSHRFENSILDKFLPKDTKKDRELNDYLLKDLFLMDDGSFYLVGEQYYKYIERNYDPRTNITTTTEHYNYNSIVVSRFSKKGKHQWTERVSKAQSSTNDYGYFSSFVTLNSGKALYFIFNDSRKNNEGESMRGYFDYSNVFNNRRSQVSYVKVDNNGIAYRGALLDEKFDYVLRAKLSEQISKESVYLMTETSRNARIVKVGLRP